MISIDPIEHLPQCHRCLQEVEDRLAELPGVQDLLLKPGQQLKVKPASHRQLGQFAQDAPEL